MKPKTIKELQEKIGRIEKAIPINSESSIMKEEDLIKLKATLNQTELLKDAVLEVVKKNVLFPASQSQKLFLKLKEVFEG